MMKFRVTVEVEADNQEEAKENVRLGDFDIVDIVEIDNGVEIEEEPEEDYDDGDDPGTLGP